MRTRYKWTAGVAASALFLGAGYMEQQSGYTAGVTDTQQKIAGAVKESAQDCLANAEWENAAILDITPRDVQDIKFGLKRIDQLPGPEAKTFLNHLGEAGLKHITIEANDGDNPSAHSDLDGAETVMQVNILSYLPDMTHDGDITFTKRVEPGLPDAGIGAARIFLSDIKCPPNSN